MPKVKFGIAGLGTVGSIHLDNIVRYVDKAEVVALADVRVDLVKELAEKYKIKKVYSDYKELADDESIDAVIIALPNFLHYDAIKTFIESGKHVFCEKPMAITLEQANDIVKIVKESALKFQVGYQRRFDSAYAKAKRLIEDGKIGLPLLARSNTRDPEPPVGWEKDPQKSGGIFLTTCTHDFDTLRWLLGAEVRKVYAVGKFLVYEDLKNLGFYDNVMVLLEFENGVIAEVDASVNCSYGYDVRTEIFGTKGAIRIEIDKATGILEFGKNGVVHDYPKWFIDRFLHAYINEIREFVKAIINDKDPPVTVEDGRAAVEIAVAAQISASEKVPIRLPL